MKVVVALGGNLADTALVRARVGGAELVIAADSGADRLRRLGLQPHAVIGDFDSLAADRIEALRTSGVEIVPHPEPQYRTDGQVALELAASRGASEVILLGVRGGPRIDHSLSNAMFLVADEFASMPITAISGWSEATGAFGRESGWGRDTVTFAGARGDYVSLIPVSQRVGGVSTHGLRWPLREADLERGVPAATSNELAAAAGGFSLATGHAIVTHQFRGDHLPDP
ncbi:MAG TPA: thiamine diphosphokinase [Dehalococcoidia bacterium]|nr:thiamine diphosphokinase [Dehalococcoidia bacterium]